MNSPYLANHTTKYVPCDKCGGQGQTFEPAYPSRRYIAGDDIEGTWKDCPVCGGEGGTIVQMTIEERLHRLEQAVDLLRGDGR